MKQTEGFTVNGRIELVCRLNNSLYDLNQSPRIWYQNFNTYILGLGFVRTKDNHCVYSKHISDHLINIAMYVDSMLLIGNKKYVIKEVKFQLSYGFHMKDLSSTNFILGMEINEIVQI